MGRGDPVPRLDTDKVEVVVEAEALDRWLMEANESSEGMGE